MERQRCNVEVDGARGGGEQGAQNPVGGDLSPLRFHTYGFEQ